MASSSSSSTYPWKYDVFLSFRGEDSRQSFTSHLHAALCRMGIKTFKDDQLRRGEKISPALLQAIEESRFSVIILSENYASSSWCLDELTKILECVKVRGHTSLPVFLNVDPSDVRKQKKSFAEAFAKHEQVYTEKMEEMVKWRKALTEVASISGWDARNRDESEIIEEIVARIFNERIINDASSSNMDGLVGMDSRVQDIVSMLSIGSDHVWLVGIWGMAGIGKSTLAAAVYDQISYNFEGCCFLQNVREDSQRYGLPYLKQKLFSQILGRETKNLGVDFIKASLCSRKVLIVLDDVSNKYQLEALAGDRDWFGGHSRIIITTKDKGLLCKVDGIYEIKELAYDEAHKLFRWHAFKHNPITEDYMQLCNRVVDYVKGLPLAITVLGSFFCNKSINEWKSALHKLKRIPHEDVHTKLKISFDGLDQTQKEIFLDIVCFFKGEDRDFVAEILESSDHFFPVIDMRVLVDKSLINVSNSKLEMHDLIQEMGLEIIRQEDVKYLGNRSRLWLHHDVYDVLTTNTGTEAIEGIVFDLSASKELNLSVDAFAKMSNLRLLRFHNFAFPGSSEYFSSKYLNAGSCDAWKWRHCEMYNDLYHECKLHICRDFKFPSYNLRSLYWLGYPLKSLPSNFHPNKLVEINLCSSRLEQLWEGNKPLEKLKFIKLSHSQHLTKIPDLSGAPNLKRLILEYCTSLVEVHPSIGSLKQLIFLNLEGCKKLNSFPSSICMESLQFLILSGCFKLNKFPEVQGKMESLRKLFLEGTAIKGLSSSFENLAGLTLLDLKDCRSLESLPISIFKLKSLEILFLSNCTRLKKLPEIQPENVVESLRELFLEGTAIKGLPSSFENLTGLTLLDLKDCRNLESLPSSIFKLKSLKTLILSNCTRLTKLPEIQPENVAESLRELFLKGTAIKGLPSYVENLTGLALLDLKECKSLESLPSNIFKLKSLKTLILSNCTRLEKLPEIQPENVAESLRELFLEGTAIKGLPSCIENLTGLALLDLKECKSLESLPSNIFKLKSLKTLILSNCSRLEKLPEIQLENMESSMEQIFLEGTAIRELPSSIGHLNRLVSLDLTNCKKFSSLHESIYELKTLQTLVLSGCSELKRLPDDLGSLETLVKLKVDESGIQEVPSSISLLSRLQSLSFAGCQGSRTMSRNMLFPFCSSPAKPLRLPSLLGLFCLENLNLSDCNLLELPDDLSSLSLLKELDLRRNSFITMPDSLSQLSMLKKLQLGHCKSLQSLPELPPNIDCLDARGCISLKTLSLSSLAIDSDINFRFTNCFRLTENERIDTVEAILDRIQLPFLPSYSADIPGSRIPEWFTHKSVGSSIKIDLPPNWYNTELMGWATCFVVNVKGHQEWLYGSLQCFLDGHLLFSIKIRDEVICTPVKDHIFLNFSTLPFLRLMAKRWRKVSGTVVVSVRYNPDLKQNSSNELVVKKFGLRLVYAPHENIGTMEDDASVKAAASSNKGLLHYP